MKRFAHTRSSPPPSPPPCCWGPHRGARRRAAGDLLELPRHRQGYYLALGNYALVTQTWEDGDSLGTWVGTGLTIRMGQMMTRRFGLGLQIDFGGSSDGPRARVRDRPVDGGAVGAAAQLRRARRRGAGRPPAHRRSRSGRGAARRGRQRLFPRAVVRLVPVQAPADRRLRGDADGAGAGDSGRRGQRAGVPVRRRPDVVDGPAQQPARFCRPRKRSRDSSNDPGGFFARRLRRLASPRPSPGDGER